MPVTIKNKGCDLIYLYRSPFRAASYQTTAFGKKGDWKCGYHTGVDRVCGRDDSLVAIGEGAVESINACGSSYGKHLVLRIDGRYSVLYAHMKADPLVRVGAKVKAGQLIGRMGNTGNSSGAHLHIEIQDGKRWGYAKNLIDPNSLIDWDRSSSAVISGDSVKNNDDADGKKAAGDKGNNRTVKKWKNGSTREFVFCSTADCRAKRSPIGSLDPWETAELIGETDGLYLIEYRVSDGKKCGYVGFGGI